MAKPIIYQMLPRLWGNGKFSSIDELSLDYIRDLGMTHVWFTGIIRHSINEAFVKGNPGSPYAISDYYDVNPYMADSVDTRMEEFENLVSRTHHKGLKVIMDFVPNHVSRDYGTSRVRNDVQYLGDGDDNSVHWKTENDFFYYPGERLKLPFGLSWEENPAKASGNCYSPSPCESDWYDTIKINYCDSRTETWDKMYNIVRYWAQKGIDGFRCDMVELVPDSFFKWMISEIKREFPDIVFIAEIYTKESYVHYIDDVGFDYLYDKSGLYDSIRAIVKRNLFSNKENISLYESTRRITLNWQSLSACQSKMLNFLENHDEQRFSSPFFGADASRFASSFCVSALFNTAPFMLYFGEELGEKGGSDGRTSIFNFEKVESVDKIYRYIHGDYSLSDAESLLLSRFENALSFAKSPLVSSGMIFDLCYCNYDNPGFDSDRHFAFIRKKDDNAVLFFANFSPEKAVVSVIIPEHASEMLGVKSGKTDIMVEPYDFSYKNIS